MAKPAKLEAERGRQAMPNLQSLVEGSVPSPAVIQPATMYTVNVKDPKGTEIEILLKNLR